MIYDALMILTVLINYQKYETPNPYMKQLAELDDELVLSALGSILSVVINNYNDHMLGTLPLLAKSSGLMSFFGSMFSSGNSTASTSSGGKVGAGHTGMGSGSSGGVERRGSGGGAGDDKGGDTGEQQTSAADGVILPMNTMIVVLSLYEAVHLNRSFVTILTHIEPVLEKSEEGESDAKGAGDINSNSEGFGVKVDQKQKILSTSAKSLPTSAHSYQHEVRKKSQTLGVFQPTNLLGTFLTFCSICLLEPQSGFGSEITRLVLNILSCISQNNYACAFIHDCNSNVPLKLYRKDVAAGTATLEEIQNKPFVLGFLNTLLDFVSSNFRKNFPVDFHCRYCFRLVFV